MLGSGRSLDLAGEGPSDLACFRLLCSFCLTCCTVTGMISLGLKRLFSEPDWAVVTRLCFTFILDFTSRFRPFCFVTLCYMLGEFLLSSLPFLVGSEYPHLFLQH